MPLKLQLKKFIIVEKSWVNRETDFIDLVSCTG